MIGGCCALATQALLCGCDGGSEAADVANPQPVPEGSLIPATVSVTDTSVGLIGPRFAGFSYEKSSMALPLFTSMNGDAVGIFRRLGPSLLRIGGYSVDKVHWNPNGAGLTGGEVAPSDIDSLATFLRATDWTALYGVNLASSTPSAAAAEVAYAVKALGASLLGIELGNECNLYGSYHFFENWNLQSFEQVWMQFREAILQQAPNVLFTGPASISAISDWTIPFGLDMGSSRLALLTEHYYRGSGLSPSSTAAVLVSPDTRLAQDLALLKTGADSIGIPFRMTEDNSFFAGGAPGISNSYASSLWVIDHLFEVALGGGIGVNLHGGGATAGYTPIADDAGKIIEARPEYYGVLLFSLVGQGTLLRTSVSASSLNVSAYAVKDSTGSCSIVIVNKEQAMNLRLTIDCGQSVHSAELLLMSGPALNATDGVRIQGAAVGADGSFTPRPAYSLPGAGGTIQCYVPALGAALIKVV